MSNGLRASINIAIQKLTLAGMFEEASDLSSLLDSDLMQDAVSQGAIKKAKFVDDFLTVKDVPSLQIILRDLCASYSVNHCTIHHVKDVGAEFYQKKIITTYPPDWIQRYVDRRYDNVDLVLKQCRKQSKPFFWGDLKPETITEHTFLEDAVRHGIGPSGYSIPVTLSSGDQFSISFASQEPDENFRILGKTTFKDLEDLAIWAVEAFVGCVSCGREIHPNLTDQQIHLLRALASGHTEEELPKLKFTYGSSKNVERQICETFKTKTIYQAAIIAARLGLLDIPPVTREDIAGSEVESSD